MLPFVLSAALLEVVPSGKVPSSIPTASSTATIPTVMITRGQEQTVTPDWSRLSFANLPAITQSGSLNGQKWSAGQPVEKLLTLGDFQDSFKLQDLNLYAIAVATQMPIKLVKLSQFKLLAGQTLADLALAVPELEQLPVSTVKPLSDLLKSAKPSYRLTEKTLPQLLEQDPTLGALSFQNFDLTGYTLDKLPGLIHAPLQAFRHWQEAKLTDIPGLREMPWQQFPNPPSDSSMSGVIQLPTTMSYRLGKDSTSISGSSALGYQIPCAGCTSITFSDPPALQKKRWISGLAQWVQGGISDVAQSTTHSEPTGRNVFGKAFKVVVTEVSPKQAQTALYFRFCQFQQQISCSPYAIGPVPFLSYRNGELMPVGNLEIGTDRSITPQMLPSVKQILPTIPTEIPSTVNHWSELLSQILEQIKALLHPPATPTA
ncbi:hypothetical protein AB3R30_15210 [Leptolyngbyaceae cyanobacterium UHCC 1019]